MSRAYTVATAALTLQVPTKWVDNVLSHYRLTGVRQSRQGVSRRLSPDGILVLAVAQVLIESLGTPVGRAIELANEVTKNHGRYDFPRLGLSVAFDLPRFSAELFTRLERAVEIAPAPKRGRPVTSKTGRLD
jgi:hypothetical protein